MAAYCWVYEWLTSPAGCLNSKPEIITGPCSHLCHTTNVVNKLLPSQAAFNTRHLTLCMIFDHLRWRSMRIVSSIAKINVAEVYWLLMPRHLSATAKLFMLCNLLWEVTYLLLLLQHPFNGLFSRTTWVSWHQKGKHSGFYWSKRWLGGSSISWAICKSFAPPSRQITMPVPHHSVFTRRMPFLLPNQ